MYNPTVKPHCTNCGIKSACFWVSKFFILLRYAFQLNPGDECPSQEDQDSERELNIQTHEQTDSKNKKKRKKKKKKGRDKQTLEEGSLQNNVSSILRYVRV